MIACSGWLISRHLRAQNQASFWEGWPCKEIMCSVYSQLGSQLLWWYIHHGEKVSALVTGEFYIRKEHFPGFGRPFVFNAEVLQRSVKIFCWLRHWGHFVSNLSIVYFHAFHRVGRKVEAKDAARGALKSPWWTLGCKYHVSNLSLFFPYLDVVVIGIRALEKVLGFLSIAYSNTFFPAYTNGCNVFSCATCLGSCLYSWMGRWTNWIHQRKGDSRGTARRY